VATVRGSVSANAAGSRQLGPSSPSSEGAASGAAAGLAKARFNNLREIGLTQLDGEFFENGCEANSGRAPRLRGILD